MLNAHFFMFVPDVPSVAHDNGASISGSNIPLKFPTRLREQLYGALQQTL